MDLDEMKRSWRVLDTRVSQLENENIRLAVQLKKTRADSLKRRLQRNCQVVACLGLLAPAMFLIIKDEVGFDWTFVLIYSGFCWLMAAMDAYLYYRLKSIDLNVLTVRDACRQAASFSVLRQRLWLTSIILLVPVLCYIFYELYRLGDIYLLVGGIVGGVLGLTLGLIKDHKMRRMIRDFHRSLDDDDD